MSTIELSCGANTAQTARLEHEKDSIDYKTNIELSYKDIISLSKGLNLISEFYDVKAACTIKGGVICAVALGQSLPDAVQKVMDSNPVDFITSAIVVSDEIDSETAKFFKNTNLVAAPKYTKNALEFLNNHNIPNVEIKTPLKDLKKYLTEDIKNTPFGTLIQTPNLNELEKDTFKIVSKQKPTVEQIEDAVFAWKIAKYNYSQSIVIAKDLKTIAVAQGLQAASIEFALDYSCDMSKDAVLASDMTLTIHDINVAAQGRIGLIIVPSADKDIVAQADKYTMSIITTGFTNILY